MHAPGPQIAVVQHEDACPLGLFTGWLREAGAGVAVARPYRGEPLPNLAGIDGLIVLGGSVSATDDDRAPWLPAVRDLLAAAVAVSQPTLGICLGHQLLAVACGGEVERNPAGKQTGVLPIGLLRGAEADRLLGPLAAGAAPLSIQWNDDIVVRLPPGAELLAATPDGIPQAMRLGDAAWGVQFHPEVDAGTVTAWAEEHGPPTPAQVEALAAIADRAAATEATGRALASGFAVVAERRYLARRLAEVTTRR
jgi:GMP synthase (glutamine-hydrolysing)